MSTVFGWDIGGVNTKAARIVDGEVRTVRMRPYELQRAPASLAPILVALAGELTGDAGTLQPSDALHAITMTAELSQMFRSKREGVNFVLDAVAAAFPEARLCVYTTAGAFVDEKTARAEPLLVAAANWAATATLVAAHHPDALLIDIGTTTTDIIPIAGGRVAAHGATDPERLASGELVYTGALRTPVEAIAASVPYRGGVAGVSAEGFALAGDVHLWRGDLAEADYSVPTPDGRPATRAFAGERLARVVCADLELLDAGGVSAIADAVAAAQVARIAEAVGRVIRRHSSIEEAVVTGLGAFLGEAAADAAGLRVTPLAADLGEAGARCAPAAAVALLLESAVPRERPGQPPQGATVTTGPGTRPSSEFDLVVKLGGGVLGAPADFEAVLDEVTALARDRRVLIVPGGGPFADAVRIADERLSLAPSAAHWMAILAMDQYAQVVASALPGAEVVDDLAAARRALAGGRIPVLAPFKWLREADPLPHSWEVTSDSIAAWVAGQVAAPVLLLIKPRGATANLVDPYFPRALPAGVMVDIRNAGEVSLKVDR